MLQLREAHHDGLSDPAGSASDDDQFSVELGH